jgi:hypothetical protein
MHACVRNKQIYPSVILAYPAAVKLNVQMLRRVNNMKGGGRAWLLRIARPTFGHDGLCMVSMAGDGAGLMSCIMYARWQ